MKRSALGLALAALLLSGCTGPGRGTTPVGSQFSGSSGGVRADVALARPPYRVVETEWKERLDQPYVFLELLGPYEETGRFMGELRRHLDAQGLRAVGPPFGLFYDDPKSTPAERRRSRLAVPVAPGTAVAQPLGYAVLPAEQVLYARVAGPYDSVSLAYPAMFAVMRERGWVLDGPIREIYQVDPATVRSFDELVTEVQMPWRPL